VTTTSRRVVTVLFADLVDFTALGERLDPEDVATIQDAYFGRARIAIERHRGSVEKFIGDAVMGSFGVAPASADAAGRAVRAGREIIDAVDEVARELGIEAGGLRVRVGVNTGEVLVTTEDDGAWRLTGDPVNVAARLQAAAEPGGLLVGPDTALAVESSFVLQPAGELRLKGREETVRAWLVLGLRATAAGGGSRRAPGPFVGRDAELRLLDTMLGDEQEHRSWLVVAPPGAGRSRLREEWAARARAAGCAVWTTGPVAAQAGYEPIARLLRAALGAAEGGLDRRSLEVRLGPSRSYRSRAELAIDHTLTLIGGEDLVGDPADLFDSWLAVLDAHDSDRRAVWIVDDVHAMSPDALTFVRHVLAFEGESDRAVLLTASPVLLTPLGPDPFPGTNILQLEPLEDESVRILLDGSVGGGVLPVAAIERVVAAAGGNPLFVDELLRVWVQTGVLTPTPTSGWAFEAVSDDFHVPATVQSIYQSDLDALGLAARRVLTVGSVPGLSFPAASLALSGSTGRRCRWPS
jgi:class 3 adenylate cyclase